MIKTHFLILIFFIFFYFEITLFAWTKLSVDRFDSY